jgi:hypothetical protein
MDGLIEGRMVHYIDIDGRLHAAVVIEIFDLAAGYVSLRSLFDLKTYVTTFSANQQLNTWHMFDGAWNDR